MIDFSQLGSTFLDVHQRLIQIYYILLPIFFMLSLSFVWFTSNGGSPEFIEKLKRVFIATLLLVSFPEITKAILSLSNWITSEISDLSGIENTISMAKERLSTYPNDKKKFLFGFNDLLVSTLTYLSYVILFLARYIMIALYHVSWLFLCCIAPIILAFHVFGSTMTFGLFRSLAEVASWKIIWAVLSLMLKALPFGAMWIEGNWLTQVFMCLTISLCMLATPLIVRSLVGQGFTSFSSKLSPAIATLAAVTPKRTMSFSRNTSRIINKPINRMKTTVSKFTGSKVSAIPKSYSGSPVNSYSSPFKATNPIASTTKPNSHNKSISTPFKK